MKMPMVPDKLVGNAATVPIMTGLEYLKRRPPTMHGSTHVEVEMNRGDP
jgi:hypothetical protein